MEKRKQILVFHGLRNMEDVSFKISQMGEYWGHVEVLKIGFSGGAFFVEMEATKTAE